IADSGDVAGTSGTHLIRWSDGVLTDFGAVGDFSAVRLTDNSTDGSVVGTLSSGTPPSSDVAFRLGPGSEQVVFAPLSDFSSSQARGVNIFHLVVGSSGAYSSDTPSHYVAMQPTRWLGTAGTALPLLPGDTAGEASSINDSNLIVGYSSTAPEGGIFRAVRWTSDGFVDTVTDLNGEIDPASGWNLEFANRINTGGQ